MATKHRVRSSFMAGFGVLEILVASAVISIAFVSLFFIFVLSQRAVLRASEKVRANFIAEEGLEIMRHLRDRGWNSYIAPLDLNAAYYLSFDAENSRWNISSSSPGLIDDVFERTARVASVMRDGSDNIVESGGVIDPDARKVIVEVEWDGRSVGAEIYLTDIFDN